jgi:hypothetical protein
VVFTGDGLNTKFFLLLLLVESLSLCPLLAMENGPEDYVDSGAEESGEEQLPPGDADEGLLDEEDEMDVTETDPGAGPPAADQGSAASSASASILNTAKLSTKIAAPAATVGKPAPVPPPGPPLTGSSKTTATSSITSRTSRPPPTTSASSSTSSHEQDSVFVFPKLYDNIRIARQNSTTVRYLNESAVESLDSVGSFKDNDDLTGPATANYKHNYTKKQNVSSSFSLDNFLCNTCMGREHPVLHREGKKIDMKSLVPVAFVLSDQNFVPAVPVGGDGECLKILRIENGLKELVELFLEATRGYIIPAGSVVILTSASYLSWVGMTIEEFFE